jgi:hypothetical protein
MKPTRPSSVSAATMLLGGLLLRIDALAVTIELTLRAGTAAPSASAWPANAASSAAACNTCDGGGAPTERGDQYCRVA